MPRQKTYLYELDEEPEPVVASSAENADPADLRAANATALDIMEQLWLRIAMRKLERVNALQLKPSDERYHQPLTSRKPSKANKP